MSFAEYAKHRGVSRAAVTQAVNAGRIVPREEDGKRYLLSEEADAQWSNNTDHVKRMATQITAEEITPPEPEETTPYTDKKSKVPSRADSMAIREAFKARIEKLNYEERVGTLVKMEEVQTGAFKMARLVRDAMLAIPDRIAAQCAAETNPFKVHTMISDEIRRALENMKEGFER